MSAGRAAISASRPPVRQHQAEAGAGHAEHHRLGDQLPQQPGAPGAERRADSQLPVPRRPAREQQVRDVAAGDEQHETNRAEQHEQWPAHVADDHLARAA